MKRYLGAFAWVVSAAACTTNKPAEAPQETTVVTPVAGNSSTTTSSTADLTPASDGTLEPSPTSADVRPTNPNDDPKRTNGAGTPTAAAPSGAPAMTMDHNTNGSVAADNTKLNKRDVNGSPPTPLDQGEGKTDLDITQKIRQAVVGDGSLSFTAKNVKIITREGKVTLRGPVNTSAERSTIQAAAQKVAGASNVDNQLEVKN
jgi:hyperosmotically inducible periplasmic protein